VVCSCFHKEVGNLSFSLQEPLVKRKIEEAVVFVDRLKFGCVLYQEKNRATCKGLGFA